MFCFPPMFRWPKSPFQPGEPMRIIEIGPPTNFRKEDFIISLNEHDMLSSCDSHGLTEEKKMAQKADKMLSKRKWFLGRTRVIRSRLF